MHPNERAFRNSMPPRRREARRNALRAWPALLTAGIALLLTACAPANGGPPSAVVPARVGDAVEIPATVHPDAFTRRLGGMPGYHLLVWSEGRAAGSALFRTPVPDAALIDALVELGATPGNALGMDAWEERKNPDSPEPDRVIEGTPIEISVRLPGTDDPVSLDEILEDPDGRGFRMRFGGHRDNIPAWRSGCLVCLFSCPGSKVGNASYTVRDYATGGVRFRPRRDALPEAGSEVRLIFRLAETP